MKPEAVSDELMQIAAEAWDLLAKTAPRGVYTHEGIKRAIIAAVHPEIERQVRAKVAAEIEAACSICDRPDLIKECEYRRAAAIARGEAL